jgi:hypothetical protein
LAFFRHGRLRDEGRPGVRSFKTVFGVIGALLPVGYCGGLLYYFMKNNTLEGPVGQGLGPTVLGLGAIGLLFCIPVVFKLIKLFAGSRPKAPGGEAAEQDEAPAFDADAALARYLARKAAGGGEPVAAEAPAAFDAPAPRATFGRKAV